MKRFRRRAQEGAKKNRLKLLKKDRSNVQTKEMRAESPQPNQKNIHQSRLQIKRNRVTIAQAEKKRKDIHRKVVTRNWSQNWTTI